MQRALGERLVAIDAADASADCVVERSVHHALNGALEEAARVLDQRLAAITLADLATDARRLTGAPFSLSRGESSVD